MFLSPALFPGPRLGHTVCGMRLELRHLQIVCAIADHGSVTKAASALGLAQPALTAQLQRIERSLGGPLFHRDRRGARPTVLGDVVLKRARIVLPAVQGLEEEVARLAAGDSQVRSYRIGAVNGPILGGLMRRLGNDDPQAHLTTRIAWDPPELARMVGAGQLDYVLIGVCGDSSPPSVPGVTWEQVAVDAVFVLLPEADPLAAKDEVHLADLADARWATTPGESCFRDCFVAACARCGFAPRHIFESDVRTCIELTESGDAVALCQSSFRPPPGLVSVPIAGTPLRWRHLLGWRPDSPAGQHADKLVTFAVDAYRETVDRLPRQRAWLETHPCFGARPTARESAV